MSYLPDDVYAAIERSMPIACVDFVPVHDAHQGRSRVGLILRHSPFGDVWCHLGGRVRYGETLRNALQRHARETLQTHLVLPLNVQPDYVYEWFPPTLAPTDGTEYGDDPRKHAIGLSFIAHLAGDPVVHGEGLDFGFFDSGDLPSPLWPGTETLMHRMGLVA